MSSLGAIASLEESLLDEQRKQLRSERFKDHIRLSLDSMDSMDEDDDGDSVSPTNKKNSNGKRLLSWEIPKVDSSKKLKGSNQELEKDYLRLTSVADASNVRPLSVLKKQFKAIREKLLADDDYVYFLNQIKSIRQDLVLQSIENKFTVKVYSLHSRIALEQGDLCEYNQCQSRIQELKRKNLKVNNDEFDCYRLIHSLYQNQPLELTNTLREIANDAVEASKEFHQKIKGPHHGLSYSMRILRAFKTGDIQKFFKMYNARAKMSEQEKEAHDFDIPPYYSIFLLDFMLSKARIAALHNALKSYLKIDLLFLTKLLGYKLEQQHELKQYLLDNKCKLVNDDELGLVLDCKLTNEYRANGYGSNNNNNNSSNNKSKTTSTSSKHNDKKRKVVISDNIYDDSSKTSNKKQKSKHKDSKDKKKKTNTTTTTKSVGMTERSKPRVN